MIATAVKAQPDSRIRHRLDSMVATVDDELDVACGQAIDSLPCGFSSIPSKRARWVVNVYLHRGQRSRRARPRHALIEAGLRYVFFSTHDGGIGLERVSRVGLTESQKQRECELRCYAAVREMGGLKVGDDACEVWEDASRFGRGESGRASHDRT